MNGLDKQGGGIWQQSLLLAILMVGTCTRFYALDLHSLTSYELNQLAVCSSHSWLDLVNEYVGFTGLPPLYPTLLCAFTGLLGNADFIVRMLSAITGLASIYLLYVMGRDFMSATAGLLAAALMAVNYQIILFDREVSINSLLLLCLLAHGYCFCRLFFFNTTPAARELQPFRLCFSGTRSSIQWTWQPDFPADGRFVVGFWVTGILAFYTSSMSLVWLFGEFVASAYLLFRQGKMLRALWLPIVITTLPWLPIFRRYLKSILEGYIFAFQSPSEVWEQLQTQPPANPTLLYLAIALLIIFIAFVLVTKVILKKHLLHESFLKYWAFQWSICFLTLWIIKSDYSSYAYISWLTVLVFMLPLACFIQSLSRQYLSRTILGFLIIASIVIQIHSNYHRDIYIKVKGSDFRLAARIIHDDPSFRDAGGSIILSSTLFNHYLERYDLVPAHHLIDNGNPPHTLAPMLMSQEFYYLDLLANGGEETNAFKTFSARYKTLCMTRLPPRVRVVKFSAEAPATTTAIADCRDHLANGLVSLEPQP